MTKVQVEKLQAFTGHREGIYNLQPADVPSAFFSSGGDGMVVRWDLDTPDTGDLIARLPRSVYAICYDHSRDAIIAGQNYEGIHVLDWKNKREVGSLQLTRAAIFDIQILDRHLFVATGDGMLIKVDGTSLQILKSVQPGDKSARSMALHLQRNEIAVGYSDHYIRVFDADTLEMKFSWAAHGNSVFTLRYTPDGNSLMSGSRDARLKVWDVSSGYTQAAEVVAHMYAINHLDFSPDGKHFVTCSMDKSIKVWDMKELKLLKVIDKARHAGHGTSVNRLLWTHHHNQLLSASDDRTISIWNITFETPLT